MTTKLYFHAASNALSGTFPTGEQATAAADWITTGANTLRAMNTTIGVSQASPAGNSVATSSVQNGFLGFFCSAAMSGAQTVGGSTNTRTINIANAESNLNMNFGFGLGFNEYVWRPGTGAKVGTVIDGSGVGGGGIEPTAAASEQVIHSSGNILTGSGVAAQDGDVIIVEVWMNQSQGMATSYTGTFYFDGTTENTTNNAVVSNHASYYQLSETLAFQAPATNATVNLTGQSATASVGTVTPSYNTTVSLTGRSATASVGTVTPSISVTLTGQSATASVGTVTETYTGQKTLTGQSATASVGTVTPAIQVPLAGQSMTASVGTVTPTVAGNTTVNLAGQAMTASTGTVSVVVPVPGPTVYYQGAGHPGKHLRRRKRRDLFDAIEATLRESVYGPDEPTPELKPAVREAVSHLEQISQGNADLLERLAVLKAELTDYRKIQAEKEKLKRLELIRQQEEDDEEAWLMVA